MSADNWAQCPRCLGREIKARKDAAAALEAAYGTVPVKEYEQMRRDLPPKACKGNTDFREDYSVYNDDEGTVTIEYTGACHVCGLSKSFRYSVDLMEEE